MYAGRIVRNAAGFVLAGLLCIALCVANPLEAQCLLLSGGCNAYQSNQCFPDANGPSSWTDPGLSTGAHTTQTRTALQSSQSACHSGWSGIGYPYCSSDCSYHPACTPAPTVSLRTSGYRILIDYEAPNYFCQNTGDWPPFYTCTNDIEMSSDRITLSQSGYPIRRAWIYYEKGTWDTGIDLPSCAAQTYTAAIKYVCGSGATAVTSIDQLIQANAPECLPPPKDRRPCTAGGGGGAPGIGVGQPINVGSGDVSLTIPLFAIAQSPLSLSFNLAYHSLDPKYPALVSAPVGAGWTHPYAQTLRPIPPDTSVLYHVTAEGYESEYTSSGDGTWTASSPGELRGTVTLSGGQFWLTDLDGTVTAFDVTTGAWLSTTDRWGNSISGTYSGGDLTTLTDSMGRQVTLSYTAGQLTQITLPDSGLWRFGYTGSQLTSIFDPLHTGALAWKTFAYQGTSQLLTGVSDEAGVLLESHAYDVQGRGTSSASAAGRGNVTVEYDVPSPGQRRVTHAIDATTNQVSVFTVTTQAGRYLPTQIVGNCATCAGAGSDTQSFAWYSDNHLQTATDGNGHLTTYIYDTSGNLTSRTEASGTSNARTSTYQYGYSSWPTFLTQSSVPSAAKAGSSKTTTYAWNTSGTPETTLNVTESGYLSASDSSPTSYVTISTFDARHRRLTVDGPRTDVTDVSTTTYYPDADADANRRGRVSQGTTATGLVSTFDAYDLFGTARTLTDPNGVVTQLVADGRGRVVTRTSLAVAGDPNEAADYVTTYAYDGRDRLTRTTLPRGNAVAYFYEDGTNLLTDTVRLDSSGNQYDRKHLTLNLIGNTVIEEDQSCGMPAVSCGAWTTRRSESYVYDAHDRLSQVVHAGGATLVNLYDADGLLASIQDERHTAANTIYLYDELHRLTRVTQKQTIASGPDVVTQYGYDVHDNLTSVTDPNGNVTVYTFDDFRRLTKQTSPVSGVTTYSYDPAGNLTASTDANLATTVRTYDAGNRITRAESTRSGYAIETVTWTYDDAVASHYGKGRLTTLTDPVSTTAYTYERRGMPRTESRTIQGDAYALGYAYDANGNRSAMTYPSGRVVSYTFDFADRPLTACSGGTGPTCTGGTVYVSSASYLPFGPESSLSYGNGTTKTVTWDARYQPSENKLVKVSDPSNPLALYTYGEDGAGNVTQITDALDASRSRTFGYDDLNRLTTATSGTSLWGTGSYAYDAMGNMTSATLGASTTILSYVGTTPKLASVTEGGTPRSVTYDAAGNESAVGAGSSAYSARNFLTAADGFTYSYNALGLRTVTTGTVVLPPTITGFTPSSGPVGTSVAVTGTSFTGATAVEFNGTSATTYTVDSDLQITATVPTGATTGTIGVTAPGGTATSAATFTVTAPPTVTGFTPTSGPAGTSVTITGTAFTGATSVAFNGTSATTFTVNSPTQITATVPVGATTGPIGVTTPQGTGTSSTSFTVTTTPTITGFSPTGGPVGTVVTITGTNLTGATAVRFNGTAATTFTVNSATQITATVPTGATTGPISVTTPGGTATSSGSFTVGALPTISGFSPTSGAAGTSVTVNGSNFTGATAVKFNGTAAAFTVNRSNKITTTVPAGATSGPISVTTPTGTATSASSFTISTPPTVTGFSPTSGPVGTSVTITGTGFIGVTAVKFNGTSATTFTVNSATQITATVPTGATTGPISVTTPQGTGTSSMSFTVTNPPTISSFSPTSGSVGTSVTIYGTAFTGATAVRFNGTAATFTVKTATRITTKVPSGATTGPISVTTPGGTATSSSSFTVPGTLAASRGVESLPEVSASVALTQTPRPEWAEPVATVASLGLDRNAIDAAGFFPLSAESGFGFSGIASDAAETGVFFPATRASVRSASRVQPLATAAGRRYSFYSPEMNLLAESEIGISASAPLILYEYVWFNGHPVAQVDGGVTHWTFTDHLGTPILQTDAAGATYWRAEHEPYGRIWAMRTADQHQPLRLPGQEAEQFNLGPNGASDRSYNIFRWYRPSWGRYTQPDPIGFRGGDENLYRYALSMPTMATDALGLAFSIDNSCDFCDRKAATPGGWNIGERIRSEGDRLCTRLWMITDLKLRKCIEKSCDHGKVSCRGDCDPDRGAEAAQTPKWWPFANRRVAFCTNTTSNAPPDWFGAALIHEFAHGCSWGHGEGRGVPLDPGRDLPKYFK